MDRIGALLVQLLLVVCYALADDVGLDYDATDLIAWERLHGEYPYYTFESTDLTPPAVVNKVDTSESHDGLFTFLTPRGTAVNESRGMVILDDEGDLVWMQKTVGQPYNFDVQEYQGIPHLTYWLGDDTVGGHGEGSYYLLNSSYEVVAQISALNDLRADLHTLSLTANDTAIISIYQMYEKEQGDRVEYIWDCLFQEIDIDTNSLLFEWRASDHHELSETFHEPRYDEEGLTNHTHWDWFHLNSVEKDDLGNYLISARYTHSISYIDGQTGDIIWTLGGKRNMFSSEDQAFNFSSQHYARFHSVDEFPSLRSSLHNTQPGMATRVISLFDNRHDDTWDPELPSRGLLLAVTYPTTPRPNDPAAYTASILQEYSHPNDLVSDSQGNLQVIPSPDPTQDPTILIGWGSRSVYTLHTLSGRLLSDSRFGTEIAILNGTVQSYHVMRYPWIGTPSEAPSAVFNEERNAVFVSWNGATEMESWALQHNDLDPEDDDEWVYVGITAKSGFETEILISDCVTKFVRVLALDGEENVLGYSDAISMPFSSSSVPSCPEINNTPLFPTSILTFGSITMTPIGLIMTAMTATTFCILLFELWRYYSAWKKRRDYVYYRLEVDPYL